MASDNNEVMARSGMRKAFGRILKYSGSKRKFRIIDWLLVPAQFSLRACLPPSHWYVFRRALLFGNDTPCA